MTRRYRDRAEAGRQLGERLLELADRDPFVLALPGGGVSVAYEVAERLGAPLDLFLVRTVEVPGNGVAMGAVASGGVRIVREAVMAEHGVTDDTMAMVAAEEQQALERSERRYRGRRADPVVRGRTVILVGDGLDGDSDLATAAAALRPRDPAELVAAVPVGDPEWCEDLREVVDALVCALTPRPFRSIAAWYDEYPDVGEEEIRDLIERRHAALEPGRGGARA